MGQANVVTIRIKGPRLMINEVFKSFAYYSIYFIEDLFSSYGEFELVIKSKDLIFMKTP